MPHEISIDVPTVMSFTVGSVSSVVLSAGKSYQFMVRAVNYCISTRPTTICLGDFSPVAVFTVRAPRAPLAPLAPYRSGNSLLGTPGLNNAVVVIRWAPPVDNGGSPITNYFLSYGAPGSPYTEINVGIPLLNPTAFTQTLEYSVGNLTDGVAYRFFVTAVNALGRSAASPVLSVIVAGFAGVDPTGALIYASIQPTIIAIDSSSVSLSWPMPPSNSTGGSPITGYKVYMYAGVGLNTLASPQVVFQEQQVVSTALPAGSPVPIGGTFTLSFNGSTTVDLSFNASASDVQTALENLPGVFSVSVNQTFNLNNGFGRAAFIFQTPSIGLTLYLFCCRLGDYL